MEFTDENIIREGLRIVNNVAKEKDLKFENYLVLKKYTEIISDEIEGKKKIVLNYYLSKPWEMPIMKGI
jgi:hypothetical protein